MGVIMLGIGVWAIYTLTALTVGENPPLRKLACWMLLTLPVGLALILAAVIFFRDVKRVARGNSPGSQSALRRRS